MRNLEKLSWAIGSIFYLSAASGGVNAVAAGGVTCKMSQLFPEYGRAKDHNGNDASFKEPAHMGSLVCTDSTGKIVYSGSLQTTDFLKATGADYPVPPANPQPPTAAQMQKVTALISSGKLFLCEENNYGDWEKRTDTVVGSPHSDCGINPSPFATPCQSWVWAKLDLRSVTPAAPVLMRKSATCQAKDQRLPASFCSGFAVCRNTSGRDEYRTLICESSLSDGSACPSAQECASPGYQAGNPHRVSSSSQWADANLENEGSDHAVLNFGGSDNKSAVCATVGHVLVNDALTPAMAGCLASACTTSDQCVADPCYSGSSRDPAIASYAGVGAAPAQTSTSSQAQ